MRPKRVRQIQEKYSSQPVRKKVISTVTSTYHIVIFLAIDKVLKERTQQLVKKKEKKEVQQLTEQGELTVLLVVHIYVLWLLTVLNSL